MKFDLGSRTARGLVAGTLLLAVLGACAGQPSAPGGRAIAVAASPKGDVPGLFYANAKWLRFVTPDSMPMPIRAQAVVKLGQPDGSDVAVDFDSGRSLGPWSAYFEGAHLKGIDGQRATVSECALICVDDLVHPGVVDGRPIRLEVHAIPLEYGGRPLRWDDFVKAPDPRAGDGYTAIRALSSDGKVLWDKAYLVDTRGPWVSARDNVVAQDLVDTASEVGFIRPGDDVAYLMHVAATSLTFGTVLLRVDLRTGALTGSDPRVRAIDAPVLHKALQEAADEAMQHAGPWGGTRPALPSKAASNPFNWLGDQAIDVPARLDWALHSRFFKLH